MKRLCSVSIAQSIKILKSINSKKVDLETRKKLLELSLISGVCIKNTRTSICHSISYPLTNHYNVPHGLAVFFTTEEVLKLILKKNKKYLYPLVRHTNYKSIDDIILDLAYISKKHKLVQRLKKYVKRFSDIDKIRNEMLTKSRSKNFIIQLNSNDLRNLLKESYK